MVRDTASILFLNAEAQTSISFAENIFTSDHLSVNFDRNLSIKKKQLLQIQQIRRILLDVSRRNHGADVNTYYSWASRSLEMFEDIKHLHQCLYNKNAPFQLLPTKCGNRLVDEGEDCDCGKFPDDLEMSVGQRNMSATKKIYLKKSSSPAIRNLSKSLQNKRRRSIGQRNLGNSLGRL
ncbi:hypothetical protein HELRODRAFT_172906 [Helobdella robusta]|uniref:Uncharacterized protein n=1 Tax=Helobdella robusta TaxID=6412 RepID=T1F640_HELRO|nr:hypothetical protein HELRODRAFT_172906 [Helobdella robusta]ESO03881.1 hypothetical protein HELRODRAFT_172906 [Helobdella robusta]